LKIRKAKKPETYKIKKKKQKKKNIGMEIESEKAGNEATYIKKET